MQSRIRRVFYRIANITMNRRGFFRRISGMDQVRRPVGAMPEESFIELCNSCAACVDVCPQKIIRLSTNNLPIVSFDHAGCTFCGRCTEVCKQGALVGEAELQSPWFMRARVSSSCLDKNGIVCRACESACEKNAIRFYPAVGGRTNVSVRLEDCNGCGACIASCHSGAIAMVRSEERRVGKEC